MIATWMLYCTAVSLLFGLAALALEHGLRLRDWPVRWAWLVSLAASLMLPIVGWFAPRGEGAWSEASASFQSVSPGVDILPIRSSFAAADTGFSLLQQFDDLLLGAWVFSSLVLLTGLLVLLVRMHRRRRNWRTEVIAGIPVLVSRSTGPAVVGFLHPQIVLPEWVLARDEETQRVVIEHEREHIRARDPYLLLGAVAVVLLMPWNAALWWQVRRLRLAIEVDCDARVLRQQPDVRRYGMLLLEVGQLAGGGDPALAAFSEPRSFLERRIRIMTRSRPHTPWPAATGFTAAGALLALAACETPQPGPVALTSSVPSTSQVEEVAMADTIYPSITDETRRELGALLQRAYPPLLRDAGVIGQAVLDFLVDEQGIPQDIKVARATHNAIGEAAIRVVRQARFHPARVGERAVPKRIQLPISFSAASPHAANAQDRPRGLPSPSAAMGDTIPPSITDEFRRQLARMLEREYPPLLRDAGVEGQAVIDFVVDEQGIPRDVKVERATHEGFGQAGIAVMREARFNPARVGSTLVAKRIQIPIGFYLSSSITPRSR